jgi:phosphohistidine swiveling domain-containing protein
MEDVFEPLAKTKWFKMGKWKQSAFQLSIGCEAILDPSMGNAIPYAPNNYCASNFSQYIVDSEYQSNISDTVDLLERDGWSCVGDLKSQVYQKIGEFEKFSPQSLNPESIARFVSLVSAHMRQWYEIMLMDGALCSLYPNSLPKQLKLDGKDYTPDALFATAAQPKKLLPMVQERFDILNIAIAVKSGKTVTDQLLEHTRKYSWLSSITWYDEPYTIEHYALVASSLAKGNPEKELESEMGAREARNATARQLLEELEVEYPQAFKFIDLARDLADLREENWDVVSDVGTQLRSLFEQVAKSEGMDYTTFNQLSAVEMQSYFETGKLPVEKPVLMQRVSNYLILSRKGLPQVAITGFDSDKVLRALESKPEKTGNLKGLAVCPGVVEGKARVLNYASEVPLMQAGEILVCPMSDPDYIPAVRKAKAIVTDQGGMLCHAAIVAREFAVPCIVGTQFATKLVKTGDLLKVDATNGTVMIESQG